RSVNKTDIFFKNKKHSGNITESLRLTHFWSEIGQDVRKQHDSRFPLLFSLSPSPLCSSSHNSMSLFSKSRRDISYKTLKMNSEFCECLVFEKSISPSIDHTSLQSNSQNRNNDSFSLSTIVHIGGIKCPICVCANVKRKAVEVVSEEETTLITKDGASIAVHNHSKAKDRPDLSPKKKKRYDQRDTTSLLVAEDDEFSDYDYYEESSESLSLDSFGKLMRKKKCKTPLQKHLVSDSIYIDVFPFLQMSSLTEFMPDCYFSYPTPIHVKTHISSPLSVPPLPTLGLTTSPCSITHVGHSQQSFAHIIQANEFMFLLIENGRDVTCCLLSSHRHRPAPTLKKEGGMPHLYVQPHAHSYIHGFTTFSLTSFCSGVKDRIKKIRIMPNEFMFLLIENGRDVTCCLLSSQRHRPAPTLKKEGGMPHLYVQPHAHSYIHGFTTFSLTSFCSGVKDRIKKIRIMRGREGVEFNKENEQDSKKNESILASSISSDDSMTLSSSYITVVLESGTVVVLTACANLFVRDPTDEQVLIQTQKEMGCVIHDEERAKAKEDRKQRRIAKRKKMKEMIRKKRVLSEAGSISSSDSPYSDDSLSSLDCSDPLDIDFDTLIHSSDSLLALFSRPPPRTSIVCSSIHLSPLLSIPPPTHTHTLTHVSLSTAQGLLFLSYDCGSVNVCDVVSGKLKYITPVVLQKSKERTLSNEQGEHFEGILDSELEASIDFVQSIGIHSHLPPMLGEPDKASNNNPNFFSRSIFSDSNRPILSRAGYGIIRNSNTSSSLLAKQGVFLDLNIQNTFLHMLYTFIQIRVNLEQACNALSKELDEARATIASESTLKGMMGIFDAVSECTHNLANVVDGKNPFRKSSAASSAGSSHQSSPSSSESYSPSHSHASSFSTSAILQSSNSISPLLDLLACTSPPSSLPPLSFFSSTYISSISSLCSSLLLTLHSFLSTNLWTMILLSLFVLSASSSSASEMLCMRY
ncbi:hypothetical protein ADUPG1_011906, partial [Aduncisulcus paluster]